MSEFKDLIGKKINKILINPDKTQIVFETNEDIIGYYSYGDCCSSSWFEHFDGVKALIGETVNEIENKDLLPEITHNEKLEKGYDVIEQYGWTFKTSKGRATLEMRNDSNGYYSGSVEKEGNPHIGDKKELKEDF